jgi:NAD(P)-dependent dehydrogenase (short-subunit alcohol dehydrogenase family)
MKRFENKVALVSGSGSGIGRATAERLASEGAKVFCSDINEDAVQNTANQIKANGGEATAIRCDVSNPEQVTATVAAVVEKYGQLDILANVAGYGFFRRTTETTFEEWSRMLSVNLTGTFLMCQAAIPHILQTRGAIINTASVAGVKSHPYSAAYCASKGGVVLLTKALAVEYGRKEIRINCVCPGGIETPLINEFKLPPGVSEAALVRISPLGRMGLPTEVAGTIAFLASDDATYINGAAIVVDGGMIA